MPQYEFPGVHVEEAGASPKLIEGVPTGTGDPLTAADGRRFFQWIAIGGAVLAGLGLWLAIVRGNAILQLLPSFAGAAILGATFVAAALLNGARALVEWRRRRAGRPPLRRGRLALGVGAFLLAQLVAQGLCLLALFVSWLIAPAFTSLLLAAFINVLIGGTWLWLAGAALRDLLLLAQAARDDR